MRDMEEVAFKGFHGSSTTNVEPNQKTSSSSWRGWGGGVVGEVDVSLMCHGRTGRRAAMREQPRVNVLIPPLQA